jgi:hypothetical protein
MWIKLGISCGQKNWMDSQWLEQAVDKLDVMHRGKNNLWTMRTILFKLSVCVYVQAEA